jgi:prepilin signal peptidase PulO-like enzyme (type II secretory pathway)
MALTIAATWLALLGLAIGSFVNLAVDRLPRGESLLRPRSHCDACGRTLTTLDLVPVAGYLVRRGRCAGCGSPIGWRQPLVELACAVALGGGALLIGLWRP